jgi:putative mycofactocin binding protein MftB
LTACAGSTEPDSSQAAGAIEAAAPYELHPDVALRPEPFGALAYHYGNRRLTFLRSQDLVDLVTALGSHESVTASMAAAGIDERRQPAMAKALASLQASGVVRRRAGGVP